MKIFGFDFTSAPSRKKPITCAEGVLEGERLLIERVVRIEDFYGFEEALHRAGPWVGGFDFPFGQPRELIVELDWARSWAGYVQYVERIGKGTFEETLKSFSAGREAGHKLLRRATDEAVNAVSPMQLDFVPVGKMFFQGAPRLLRAGVNILPCRPNGDSRVALEVYPALVARALVGRRSYKQDARKQQTEPQRATREALVNGLVNGAVAERYGVQAVLREGQGEALVEDATGDLLDAVLCAIQAGWAAQQTGYGIPAGCDGLEGWIVGAGSFYYNS